MTLDRDEGAGAVRVLRLAAGAMAAGLTVLAGAAVALHLRSAQTTPTAEQILRVNWMTTAAMIVSAASIAASELLWRVLRGRGEGSAAGRARTAYLARLACREGAGLVGLVVACVAALDGVLRVYPAYWVNGVPYLLFLTFLAAHWPSENTLLGS